MGTAGGGRVTRALRLLLLLVLALAAVEYLFGSILEATPLRTYLYAPMYNDAPAIKSKQLPTHVAIGNPMKKSNRTSTISSKKISIKKILKITCYNVSEERISASRTKIMEGIPNLMTTEEDFRAYV